MRRGCGGGLLLAALCTLFSSGARAATLADVVAEIGSNGSYAGSIGDLSFSFTKVEESGGIALDQIELLFASDALGTGFDLVPESGALRVADGALADLKLEFTVSSTLGIAAAGNALTSSIDPMASASVSELIVEVPGVDLGVSNFAPSKFAELGAAYQSLTINSKNLVLASMAGGSAEVLLLQQRFTVVPEPASGALTLAGLAGLAAAGGRRRASSR
jgi:hypothetical protein